MCSLTHTHTGTLAHTHSHAHTRTYTNKTHIRVVQIECEMKWIKSTQNEKEGDILMHDIHFVYSVLLDKHSTTRKLTGNTNVMQRNIVNN